MNIRVTLTGRSYHAASQLPAEIELADGANLSDVLARIDQLLPDDAPLPGSCLVALGGQHVGAVANYQDVELRDGQELTLVAPVAGG